MEIHRKTQVVVVGSGPGGSTVAMKLAQAGKKVLLLEKGRDNKMIGNHLSALSYVDKIGLRRTEEGLNVIRGVITGGSTILYCGAATEPPAWFKTGYGIDLDDYCAETIKELNLEPLPDESLGVSAKRLLEAGNDLGHGFVKLRKFIDPRKCRVVCGGTCMLGCPYGAKWSAREYIRQMITAGGELITRADVQEVTIHDDTATGVMALVPGGILKVDADQVIVSAGGLGTPTILQKSGIHEAGSGMFLDPLVFVSGVSRHPGTTLSPPMSVGTYEMMEDGILISDLIDPWLLWLIMAVLGNPARVLDFFSYRRHLSLMVKIGDELEGFITMNNRISKPLTARDRFRLNKGAAISRKILIKAGCDPRTIIVGPVRGAHPGATARIGLVVNENLETRVKNLYVSDASVVPEALDRPTVLTLISLAKRLADHLLTE